MQVFLLARLGEEIEINVFLNKDELSRKKDEQTSKNRSIGLFLFSYFQNKVIKKPYSQKK